MSPNCLPKGVTQKQSRLTGSLPTQRSPRVSARSSSNAVKHSPHCEVSASPLDQSQLGEDAISAGEPLLDVLPLLVRVGEGWWRCSPIERDGIRLERHVEQGWE